MRRLSKNEMLTQRNGWSNIIIQKYAHVNFTESWLWVTVYEFI